MTTPRRASDVVRFIEGIPFRDSSPREPVKPEPREPEWIRRAKAGRLPVKQLS